MKLSEGDSIEIAHISIWIACHLGVYLNPQKCVKQELGPSSLEYSRETLNDS